MAKTEKTKGPKKLKREHLDSLAREKQQRDDAQTAVDRELVRCGVRRYLLSFMRFGDEEHWEHMAELIFADGSRRFALTSVLVPKLKTLHSRAGLKEVLAALEEVGWVGAKREEQA